MNANVEDLRKYMLGNGTLGSRTVRLFLMNGYQMTGTIKRLEEGWLVFEANDTHEEQIIFLQAISTIK